MPKQSSSSTVWKVILAILVGLLILLIVVEAGLRWYFSSQMRDGFEQSAAEQGVTAAEDPEVSFGAQPLIWGIATGSIGQISMTTPSTLQIDETAIAGTPAASITMEGMEVAEDPTVEHLTASTELPEDYLLRVLQTQIEQQLPQDSLLRDIGAVVISDITANPEANTLDVELGSGLATLTFAPAEVDGRTTFEAVNATLFGFDMPAAVSDQITQALQDSITEAVGGSMSLTGFEVVDGGIRVTMSGNDVLLSELSTQPSDQSQPAA